MKQLALGCILLFLFNPAVHKLCSQNMLIVERPGTIKNIKFKTADKIKIEILPTGEIFSGKISSLSDSIIILNKSIAISMKDVKAVYKRRWGTSFLQEMFLKAGIAYLGISLINGAINHDEPLITTGSLIIGSGLTITGVLLTPLTKRKFTIDNQRWRLRLLVFE